jgi:hypothetical protein
MGLKHVAASRSGSVVPLRSNGASVPLRVGLTDGPPRGVQSPRDAGAEKQGESEGGHQISLTPTELLT